MIVRPRQPYLDWAANLDDSGLLPDSSGEQTVYLVPSIESNGDTARILKMVYAEVFERELHGWHTDEAAWPKNRTLRMFKEWFQIEFHSIVEDLCGYELGDDES